MKRGSHDLLVEEETNRKRLYLENAQRFIEEYKGELKFEPKNQIFVDKNDLIQAYVLNGVLYNHNQQPFDLKVLDMPKNICIDVWYVIMKYLDGGTILRMENLCRNMRKAALRIWNEKGKRITELYGPIFNTILTRRKMDYPKFFRLCGTNRWSDTWLPFATLFVLPAGRALEYVGKGGPCSIFKKYKQTYGVILTNNGHAGFVKQVRVNTIKFYWGTWKHQGVTDIHDKSVENSLQKRILCYWNYFVQDAIAQKNNK